MTDRIVTRESLAAMILPEDERAMHAIGRALVLLFKRQTRDEKDASRTNSDNGVGFTPSDAKQGSINAKYYMKHGRLEPWMVSIWTKKNVKGIPRLAKYHSQLNEEAVKKQLSKAQGELEI